MDTEHRLELLAGLLDFVHLCQCCCVDYSTEEVAVAELDGGAGVRHRFLLMVEQEVADRPTPKKPGSGRMLGSQGDGPANHADPLFRIIAPNSDGSRWVAADSLTGMSLLRNQPQTRFADTGDRFVAYQTFGRGRDLDERGSHELKGVSGEWRLYAVSGLP